MRALSTPAALTLPLVSAGCLATDGEHAPAAPQRPSYSSDTATTAAGTVELEAGVARDDEEGVDVPVTLKYGAGEHIEVFVGLSPYQHAEAGGTSDCGVSDLVVGARHRTSDGGRDAPSRAFQVAAKLPTGDEADLLSSGEVDLFGAFILTGAKDGLGWTGFYQLGLLGDPDEAGLVVEHGLALAVGHAVARDDLSAFAELAAVVRPEWDEEELFTTLGVALTPHPDLVLDAFVVLGLSDDAPDAAVGIGFTRNLSGVGPVDRVAP